MMNSQNSTGQMRIPLRKWTESMNRHFRKRQLAHEAHEERLGPGAGTRKWSGRPAPSPTGLGRLVSGSAHAGARPMLSPSRTTHRVSSMGSPQRMLGSYSTRACLQRGLSAVGPTVELNFKSLLRYFSRAFGFFCLFCFCL